MQIAKQTITFRTKAETRNQLDKVADAMNCDRSYILNQAIEARNGEFVPEQEVSLEGTLAHS